jgi:DMSO/TMAO reductase YedYZ molybdopterin-dependent catalytic subunit
MRETSGTALPRHDSISASKELVRVSAPARQLERRLFLKQGLSLGALTLLTGCDVTDTTGVQRVLNGISEWNDRTQAAIFNPRRLMPTYPESQAVKDFRYNAYYGQGQIPKIDGTSYKLNLSGLVDSRKPWTLDELYALPAESPVTRHVCVEGWSMIEVDRRAVPHLPAAHRRRHHRQICRLRMRWILFQHRHGLGAASADFSPSRFPTISSPRYGYPLKLRIPTKLSPKIRKWIRRCM